MLKFPGVLKQAQLCDVMPLMELCYHGDRRAPSQNSTEFWQLKKLQKFQLSHHLRTFQHLQMWKLPRSEALLVCLRSYGLWATLQSSAYICVCVCVCVCVKARAKALQSCPTLCDPLDYNPPGLSVQRFSRQEYTKVGYHALLQGIFLTQGSNPCLLDWQADSLPLVPPGKPINIYTYTYMCILYIWR